VVYGCPRLAHAANLGLYSPKDEEVIELEGESGSFLRKKVLKLYSIQSLPFCDYCDGTGELAKRIPPAEQMQQI
jgi:hypothetical protein